MTDILISEIFHSIQGEGIYQGIPMVFVRLQGCSLGCDWCDTKYTWPEGKTATTVEKVQDTVLDMIHSDGWVCVTGGEPLEQPEAFAKLVFSLTPKFKVEVETSGLVKLPPDPLFSRVDSWVVDLKPISAKAKKSQVCTDFERLRKQDQLKLVVKDQQDLQYTSRILRTFPTKAVILVSPVFSGRGQLDLGFTNICVEFCKQNNFRLSLQIHKFLWGMKRGV